MPNPIKKSLHVSKKFLLILFITIFAVIGGVTYVLSNQKDDTSATCNNFFESKPGPLDEPPAVCLPGYNTPHVVLEGPENLNLAANSSKLIKLKIKNNKEITRDYKFNVISSEVKISGLPEVITIKSGETKSIKVKFITSANRQNTFSQISIEPTGGDSSDSDTLNTEITIK